MPKIGQPVSGWFRATFGCTLTETGSARAGSGFSPKVARALRQVCERYIQKARYEATLRAWAEGDREPTEARYEAYYEIKNWLRKNNQNAELCLMRMGLCSVPPLPPGLKSLNISFNFFQEILIPEGLEKLDCSANYRLTSLGARLPSSLKSLRALNPLTSLPENILLLPNECQFEIAVGFLPEAILTRLRAATSANGYNGPRISFCMDRPREVRVQSLSKEISLWSTAAENVSARTWRVDDKGPALAQRLETCCNDPTKLNRFSDFLGRLRETNEYQTEVTHVEFCRRVCAMLIQIIDDSAARDLCFGIAEEAITSCGDRVALGFLDMEAACHIARVEADLNNVEHVVSDKTVREVVASCKAQYRNQVLRKAAAEKIKSLNFVDEIEVVLGFIVACGGEFGLKHKMSHMLYARYSHIEPKDVVDVRKRLSNQDFDDKARQAYKHFFDVDNLNKMEFYKQDGVRVSSNNQSFIDFLLESSLMKALLNRLHPGDMGAFEARVSKDQDDIQKRLVSLSKYSEDQYLAQCNALKKEYDAVRTNAAKEIILPCMREMAEKYNFKLDLS